MLRIKNQKLLSFVVLISLLIAIYPSSAARFSGDRPYFTNKPASPIELLDKYPENKIVTPLDERIGTAAYNNVTSRGVMFRAAPDLWSGIPYSSNILARNTKSTTDPNWYRCASLSTDKCKDANVVSLDLNL